MAKCLGKRFAVAGVAGGGRREYNNSVYIQYAIVTIPLVMLCGGAPG